MINLGAFIISFFLGFSFPAIPVSYDSPGVTTEITFEEPVSSTKSHDTYSFPRYSTQIAIPNIYSVQKNEFEPLRRGADSTYDLTYLTSNTQDYYISEIQFFTQDSVKRFSESCDASTDFCFEGYAPTPTDFENLKKALASNTKFTSNYYDNLNPDLVTINETPVLRIHEKCRGDICSVTQYYYLQGDNIISINIISNNSQNYPEATLQNFDSIAEEVLIAPAQ